MAEMSVTVDPSDDLKDIIDRLERMNSLSRISMLAERSRCLRLLGTTTRLGHTDCRPTLVVVVRWISEGYELCHKCGRVIGSDVETAFACECKPDDV